MLCFIIKDFENLMFLNKNIKRLSQLTFSNYSYKNLSKIISAFIVYSLDTAVNNDP